MKPALFLCLLVLAANGARAESPRAVSPRAVSLDYCADQYLLALADRVQIAALSPLADDEFSFLRAEVNGLKRVRPSAEEIAPLRPDVVFRFWGGAPRLSEALTRGGAKVVTMDYASDFDGVRANIRRAAAALGQAARGEALVADLNRRLAALAAKPLHPVAALYVTPGGVTAGKGTMIDAIFAAARVPNAASEAGFSYWPALPAEALLLDPPGLIVTGFFTADGERANHWSAARHPTFRKLFEKTPAIHLPADVLSCPAWFSVNAAETIAAELGAMRTGDVAR